MAFDATATVRRWAKNVERQFTQINRGAIAELGRRTIERTPVDTGRARAGYHVTVHSQGVHISNSLDPSGQATAERIRGAVSFVTLGQTVWLTNNVPYIIRLEYGFSRQSPAGFMRITAREWQSIVDFEAGKARI